MQRPSRLTLALLPAVLLPAVVLYGGAARNAPPVANGAAPLSQAGILMAVAQKAQHEAELDHDPLTAELAFWLRAQIPSAAPAAAIDRFLRDNPDWPERALLKQRLQQALAVEPDTATARTLCLADPPDTPLSLLRCAAALETPQDATAQALASLSPGALPPVIAADAARAWVEGIDDPEGEAEFIRLFKGVPTPAQQWQRFDRLEWSGQLASASRQIARLSAADRPLAIARLALHRGQADADVLAASLQRAATTTPDPAMLLDLARWLRRDKQDDAALALWHGQALAAEADASSARRGAYWRERDALARDLLSQNRDRDALFLARDRVQTSPSARLESDFLTGWILLRRLRRPAEARPLFTTLAASNSLITSSRGYYWLGRASLAQGRDAEARRDWRQAALRPTTFYGQAAFRRLAPDDQRLLAAAINQARGPSWSESEALQLAGRTFARAATLLAAWGDPQHARLFLLGLNAGLSTPSMHALAAAFSDRLHVPDAAVAIARKAGQDGLLLGLSGWPRPFATPSTPALPPGLALAIMRQESSFDPSIVSPAGADGLMQLMPATARTLSTSPLAPASLFDPQTNMVLGTRYLANLLDEFGGTVAFAVAAYNAGPNRVRLWQQQNGLPTDQTAMIDWIELIPFGETRNYVQRVMESQTVYQVRASLKTHAPRRAFGVAAR